MNKTADWEVKKVEKVEGFDQAFPLFFHHCKKVMADYLQENYPNSPTLQQEKLEAKEGGRFVKIIRTGVGTPSGSAWGFVDKTNGDVLKPAGWNAPAKGARANIFDQNTWKNVGAYGPAYVRNMQSRISSIASKIATEFKDSDAVVRWLKTEVKYEISGSSTNTPEVWQKLREKCIYAIDYGDRSGAVKREVEAALVDLHSGDEKGFEKYMIFVLDEVLKWL